MNDLNEYINSGILEMYVLGMTNDAETSDVYEMSLKYPEIENEIECIVKALEMDSINKDAEPNLEVKALVFATIDYSERLKNGEPVSVPPILNSNSKIIDFEEWISRKDMVLPEGTVGIFGKIIGFNSIATTLIAWVKTMTSPEIHTNEYERFLVIEGTCDIKIGEELFHLNSGDYKEIPLFIEHSLIVTSKIPCKVILQRVAA